METREHKRLWVWGAHCTPHHNITISTDAKRLSAHQFVLPRHVWVCASAVSCKLTMESYLVQTLMAALNVLIGMSFVIGAPMGRREHKLFNFNAELLAVWSAQWPQRCSSCVWCSISSVLGSKPVRAGNHGDACGVFLFYIDLLNSHYCHPCRTTEQAWCWS